MLGGQLETFMSRESLRDTVDDTPTVQTSSRQLHLRYRVGLIPMSLLIAFASNFTSGILLQRASANLAIWPLLSVSQTSGGGSFELVRTISSLRRILRHGWKIPAETSDEKSRKILPEVP